jgi:nucleotide-binding universal stress UspA family protein
MAQPVIVGIDDAPGVAGAVDWAADEAWRRRTRLHLVHAWLPQPADTPEAAANPGDRRAAEDLLAWLAERAAARQPRLEVGSGIVETGPREALEQLSRAAELLVLGRRGSGGFPGLLTGSTSLRLAADAACPVVIVPEAPGGSAASAASAGSVASAGSAREGGGGVAVGVRGRDAGEVLLTYAFEAAQRLEAPLRVVHAWRNPLLLSHGHALPPVYERGHIAAEQTRLLAEILAGWRQKYPDVPVEVDTVRSGAAKRLVELSATERLLVVGRHGASTGPVARLGSVSQAVVHHAGCPVAVVPTA